MDYRESHTPVTDLGFPPPPSLDDESQDTPEITELESRLSQLEQLMGVEWCADCGAYHPIEEDARARQTRLSGGGAPLSAVTGSAHSAFPASMGPGTM